MPSMPAPFSSTDPGEAWVWGDFVILLQTKPILILEMMRKMTGQKDIGIPPLAYPYAMTVFYRKDKNPHGPSNRPILVATLERMNYDAVAKMLGAKGVDVKSTGIPGDAPIVQGLFTAKGHLNLGHFQGFLTLDSARDYFLDLIQRQLSLVGEPVRIGAIRDIYGHPNTGWPAEEKKKSRGCLGVLAVCVFLLVSVIVILLQIRS
jgi:hypothetical protein